SGWNARYLAGSVVRSVGQQRQNAGYAHLQRERRRQRHLTSRRCAVRDRRHRRTDDVRSRGVRRRQHGDLPDRQRWRRTEVVRTKWPLGSSRGLSLPRRTIERQRAGVLRPADAVWSSRLRRGDHQRGSVTLLYRRRALHFTASASTRTFEILAETCWCTTFQLPSILRGNPPLLTFKALISHLHSMRS